MFEEREYQDRDVNYAMDHGPDLKPIHCIATGGGKTYCQAMIAKREMDRGNPVGIITPRVEIFDQTHGVLNDVVGYTNVATLKSGERWLPYLPVHIISWDTLISRVKRDPFWYPDVKRLIIDEAHLSLSPAKARVLEHYAEKGVLLDGYTATPSRPTGKGLGGMYTNIKNIISVKELINRGYLAPCEYWGGRKADLAGVRVQRGDYVTKDLSRASRPLVGDVIDNWGRLASGRHTIVFTVDVPHCEALAERYQQAGIKAEALHIYKTPAKRREIVEKFRKREIQVLVNVTIASYGFDVPSVDCIVLARPTKSIVLWLQMIGRGMRAHPGKEFCMVIDHTGGSCDPALGYAEELRRWRLDNNRKSSTNWSRDKRNTKKEPDEEKSYECSNEECGFIFSKSLVCPRCGTEVPMPKRDIQSSDADLRRMSKRRAETKQDDWPDNKAFFLMLRHHANKRGFKLGWAMHLYKEKTKEFPPKTWNNSPTIVPSVRVANWIKSRQIAFFKRRKKETNGKRKQKVKTA